MKTLVLNAGYEPMSVISFRRAVILVLNGKASVLAEDEGWVRSCTVRMGRPSVIILRRYVPPPRGRKVALSRRGVLQRDNHTCGYCNQHANTIDHIVPRSRGGTNCWTNLVACCRSCNNRKGSRTLDELGWPLLITPQAPHTGRMWLREIEDPTEKWRPYLQPAQAA